jgi:hypothetical protein
LIASSACPADDRVASADDLVAPCLDQPGDAAAVWSSMKSVPAAADDRTPRPEENTDNAGSTSQLDPVPSLNCRAPTRRRLMAAAQTVAAPLPPVTDIVPFCALTSIVPEPPMSRRPAPVISVP